MPKRTATVIAYDISDSGRRCRAARIMRQWRLDGQRSVAECLLSLSEADELFLQLTDCLDDAHDRLLLCRIPHGRSLHRRGAGKGAVPFARQEHLR